MKSATSILPRSAETFSLGRSIDDNYIIGVRLNENDRKSIQDLKPMVKLVGNIHGNEPVGRELLMHFANYLLKAASLPPELRDRRSRRAAKLLETTDIWIFPSMNPDGFQRGEEGVCQGGDYLAGRLNEGNQDLNRDFPTWQDYETAEKDKTFDIFETRQI